MLKTLHVLAFGCEVKTSKAKDQSSTFKNGVDEVVGNGGQKLIVSSESVGAESRVLTHCN